MISRGSRFDRQLITRTASICAWVSRPPDAESPYLTTRKHADVRDKSATLSNNAACAQQEWCGRRLFAKSRMASYEKLAFLKGALPIEFFTRMLGLITTCFDARAYRTPSQRIDGLAA
jgi:hypothetical protein